MTDSLVANHINQRRAGFRPTSAGGDPRAIVFVLVEAHHATGKLTWPMEAMAHLLADEVKFR